MPLVDSPAPGVRRVSTADLLYTTSSRFPGQEQDDRPHLCDHVFAWCHVIAFLTRRLAGSGLRAAIEGLPLDALAGECRIVVSVFVEGVSIEVEDEMACDLNNAIARTPYAAFVHVHVLGVHSIDEVMETVRTLGHDAVDCIHGALMDDADSFRPHDLTAVQGQESVADGFMVDRRMNDERQGEEVDYAADSVQCEDTTHCQGAPTWSSRLSDDQTVDDEQVRALEYEYS
ncbi:hypothetical protein [Paraburkholderia sp. RL17-337-BIB-A]|uniref:hypothetical protein n=1 Tax=Paraburkholderia sp. RL17-337-BIB-A TaxID=3031636 RepID=UPI0038BA9766